MGLERIEDVSEPEIGRFYLVPTVRGEWLGMVRDWPVLGPEHRDKDCFNFPHSHYHFDQRFLPERRWKGFWRDVQASPLQTHDLINPDGLPKPVYRRRRLLRLVHPGTAVILKMHTVRTGGLEALNCLVGRYAGLQARHDGRGWVCPHRQVPLNGQTIQPDGSIVCPAHMLRIDAATGLVLPSMAEALP